MDQITENIYLDSAPDFFSEQSMEARLLEFARAGVELVVSLRTYEPLEASYRALGIEFHHIPVAEFDIPTSAAVREFIDLIEANLGRMILIHCFAGRGRSGTMMALYLKYRGMDGAAAIAFVRERRAGAIETDEQERFILEHDFEPSPRLPRSWPRRRR